MRGIHLNTRLQERLLWLGSSLLMLLGLAGFLFAGPLAHAVQPTGASWSEYWCANEVYVGIGQKQVEGIWQRYTRDTTPVSSASGCSGKEFTRQIPSRTSGTNVDTVCPESGSPQPNCLYDAKGHLKGADQVVSGAESNTGFVTQWHVDGVVH